ncbi:MAG: efflux RND transporter periplasmic adaptor subunit, partial [Candidatus Acidiferrales bacterium]
QRGSIIAEIDPQTLQARFEQARAQLEMDRVALAKTQRDLARGRQLFASGLIPSQQIEDLEWQVKAAHAKVDKSESDLKAAAVDLSYTVIRAPISGIVASVSTQEGETVAASFAAPTFVTIVEDNALELVALVDETDIAGVKAGDPVSFTVEAYPSRELAGTVKRIDPTATIISGVVNYPVIASIQKDVRLLKPDMTANISIRTAEHQALVIPNAAIQRDGEERFVYVTRNGEQEKQRVTIGTREEAFTEIRKGLSVNDHVLANGSSGSQKKDQKQ